MLLAWWGDLLSQGRGTIRCVVVAYLIARASQLLCEEERMDRDAYNGWPNKWTWHLYCHLSSYEDSYSMACHLVTGAPAPHLGADRLRDWVQENIDAWVDTAPPSWLTTLSTDLLHGALEQVDWDHLARAFDELSS